LRCGDRKDKAEHANVVYIKTTLVGIVTLFENTVLLNKFNHFSPRYVSEVPRLAGKYVGW